MFSFSSIRKVRCSRFLNVPYLIYKKALFPESQEGFLRKYQKFINVSENFQEKI